jgi:transposase
MAMGKRRRRPKQTSMWLATQDLPRSAAHPFYARLNQILDKADFDGYVEGLCQRFYAHEIGRPGLPPGRYFRLLLIGYFEGLDAERAIAWAGGRFVCPARVSRIGAAGGAAGSFDDFAHAAIDYARIAETSSSTA